MSTASEPVGTLDVALAHTARLLQTQPLLAAEQAREILKAVPGHPHARLLLATARRLNGDLAGAVTAIESLAREQPRSAATFLELGAALGDSGRGHDAIAALQRAVELQPDLPDAWRLLADHFDATGDRPGADRARGQFIRTANRDPRLMAAASALCENDLPRAEVLLRAHLKVHETDVAALRMLAEVAGRLRRYRDAELLLERCIELAPSFDAARHNLAIVLQRQARADEARPHVLLLLAKSPRNPGYRTLMAAVHANLGDYDDAIAIYAEVLREYPSQPAVLVSYGHTLRTAGRHDESIEVYRRAMALEPTLGEAYWSLANLKTFRFTGADVEAMRRALARDDLGDEDRLHVEFALGKALEDVGEYQESFLHYAAGNGIRLSLLPYDANDTTVHLRRSKELYTPEFLAARAGGGAPDAAPIFVVGLPRAGSTLLEQILASHPLVEGTMELPDLPAVVREISLRERVEAGPPFYRAVAALADDERRALGERYLELTRGKRKTARPYFIDKMPNNYAHVGLIHLILPNARIIDARRHPLACCFSDFKQHFARGQNFAYSLEDLGRYYCDYVELMAHFDSVLPGRVHRVFYERMIDDTETEIRRLLEYCGLPFDERCLRFYETDRAVRTPSSEQVRRPIYRDGVDHWRHFEPWLGPLREALGEVLERYPGVPDFGTVPIVAAS